MAQQCAERARRFSDEAMEALVVEVQRRRAALYPPGGAPPSKLACRRLWEEIAESVTATSVVPRSAVQCRKKFNDLARLGKAKVAHNRREQQQTGGSQPAIEDLTDLEESVLEIIGGAVTESVASGEAENVASGEVADDDDTQEMPAGQPVPPHPHTEGGDELEEEEEEEEEETLALHLTLAETNSENGTVWTLEGSIEAGSAHVMSAGTSVLQLGQGERVPQEPAPRRASSRTSSAPRDSDDDLDGAAFRRRVMGMHTEMLGTMASLPESLLTVSRSIEESGSNIARSFAQNMEPMISRMEMMRNSRRDRVDPQMMGVMDDLAASIAAQAEATEYLTAAMEAQTAAIFTGFTSLERGLQGVTAGQQSVRPQIARNAEARLWGSVSRSVKQEPTVLSQDDSIPTSTTATPPLPLPMPVAQTATAHAEMVQSTARPSKSTAGRRRRAKASVVSSTESQQPSTNRAEATGGALRRSTRSGKGIQMNS